MKSEEMDGHTNNQQQGGNPLQEPRPETPFFYVHYFLPQSTPSTQRIRKIIKQFLNTCFYNFYNNCFCYFIQSFLITRLSVLRDLCGEWLSFFIQIH
ncbi:cobalamin biosynthesis protein CobN and related Mg-chelatases [Candidatus Brocadia sinica JPN1]|uniref:Cobalamin biosynthesis protein CobN and related Mg-chelatases n=1 Tax=Candidatus Brocadia sinica JPN1 TaxID=1197129 RepID=A0ABQ0JX71_9BACT|nr:cobalamin biosynthesis protein CobN and related Mg-chelatases [Candidatus Brocadia sinica JPN1]